MSGTDLVYAVGQLGLSFGLCVFFVWWSWRRETNQSERIAGLEDKYLCGLVELIRQSTEAARTVAQALDGLREAIKEQRETLADVIRKIKG